MDSIPHAPGIYQILCVPTGKVYIGSAIDIRRRWKKHCTELNTAHHKNVHLLRAWSKYGAGAFVCSVLELVMFPEYLIEREQYWINTKHAADPDRGFNICAVAGSTLGVKPSPETIATQRAKIAKIAKTREGFVDPDGNEVTINNLWDFCNRNGLSHSQMHGLISGRVLSHKGWTYRNARLSKREKVYSGLISPEGERIPPFSNISKFCRDRGWRIDALRYILSGQRKDYKGWTYERGDDGV